MRRSFILVTLLGACAGAAALGSCSSNSNEAILPITVVDIPIGDLLNSANLGCGSASPYDVYKYAAIITLVDEEAGSSDEGDASCRANATGSISIGLSDCFATHVFSNLPETPNGDPVPDGGSAIYTVKVFFYNLATYCSIEQSDPVCASVKHPEKNPLSAALNIEAGANVETLCDLPATWTATCIATEQGNITVNAACPTIVLGSDPPDAGSEDATTDAKADASIKDGAGEGPANAGLDAPLDAPLDGSADAGATDAPPG